MMKISILFYKLDGVFPRHTPSQRIPCSTVLWTFHLCHTTHTAATAAIGLCIAPFPFWNQASDHKQALTTPCWRSTQGRVCWRRHCLMPHSPQTQNLQACQLALWRHAVLAAGDMWQWDGHHPNLHTVILAKARGREAGHLSGTVFPGRKGLIMARTASSFLL